HIRFRAQEQCTVLAHVFQKISWIAREHLDMLVGELVSLDDSLFLVFNQDDLTVICPRLTGDLGSWKHRQLSFDFGRYGIGKLSRGSDKRGRRRITMFGLTQQVGDHHADFGAVVGDDQYLGWSGEQIDTHPAEKLALGFRHIGVAGPYQHVHRRNRFGTQGHGRDGLYTPKDIDFVGSGHRHGCNGFWMRLSVGGRHTGDNARHSGYLGSDDAHVRRRHHGILAARHVAADGTDRNVGMTQGDPRKRFYLDVLHGGPLYLGKVADLGLCESDVVKGYRIDRPNDVVDLFLVEFEGGW